MADHNHLFGSCACERNVYEISIPTASSSLAQVFFDNSTASRKATATPVTAWLRVPLQWYQSATFAHFPDESHSSIKRSFNAPTNSLLPPTRRQFCGFCGTHLTAWNEALHAGGYGNNEGHDYLDVTLGSLLNESLERLEALKILPDDSDEESVKSATEGLSKSGVSINEEEHIETNERRPGGVDGPPPPSEGTPVPVKTSNRPPAPHRMQGRGVPYFEEMIEHSRLGRIKRHRGGHTSSDGTTRVQWEVVEIEGDEPVLSTATMTDIGGNKRLRTA